MVYDSGVSVFPLGKARSVVDIVLYEYFATSMDLCYWDVLTDCVLINIPVTPLALLCNCINVECLSSVLVGRIFLFGGFRCVYIWFFLFVF